MLSETPLHFTRSRVVRTTRFVGFRARGNVPKVIQTLEVIPEFLSVFPFRKEDDAPGFSIPFQFALQPIRDVLIFTSARCQLTFSPREIFE